MRRLLILLVLLGVIAAGVFEWANAVWPEPGPATADGKPRVVLIPPHTRAHAVAALLEEQGALNYALVFEFDLRWRHLAEQVKAGEYAIPSRASMADIAAILVAGKSIEHKLTAAEGLTSGMIYRIVVTDPVLQGDAGPPPAEGTLLPETYLFTRGETRAHMLAKMRAAQDAFLQKHWPARTPGLPLKSSRDAVTLASIVEKETALPDERPHIASVFVNRLRDGMRLQSDPTIIYGITKGYPLGHGIRQSELAGATPYNTYVIAGLPPTPIANPGKDAIAAVLQSPGHQRSVFRRQWPGRPYLRLHRRGPCPQLSRPGAPRSGSNRAGDGAARSPRHHPETAAAPGRAPPPSCASRMTPDRDAR